MGTALQKNAVEHTTSCCETGPILGVLFVFLHSVESNIFYHMSANASSLFIATSFKVGSLANMYSEVCLRASLGNQKEEML